MSGRLTTCVVQAGRQHRGEHDVPGPLVVLVGGHHDDESAAREVCAVQHGSELLLQPRVGRSQRAVVGVVHQVGDQEADGGQRVSLHGVDELREADVEGPARTAAPREVHPRVVPYGVVPGVVVVAALRHRLGEGRCGLARIERLVEDGTGPAHLGCVSGGRGVVRDAERGPAHDREVVGLARVGQRLPVRRVAVLLGLLREERHAGLHLGERVVLLDDDEDLRRHPRGLSGLRRLRGKARGTLGLHC